MNTSIKFKYLRYMMAFFILIFTVYMCYNVCVEQNNVSNLRYISRSDNQKNKYVTGKFPYRHISKQGNGFQIKIKKNYEKIFYKCSRKWTLEDAIKVRNEAYIKLGIEIDDATRN